jgi:hypothetical protein
VEELRPRLFFFHISLVREGAQQGVESADARLARKPITRAAVCPRDKARQILAEEVEK